MNTSIASESHLSKSNPNQSQSQTRTRYEVAMPKYEPTILILSLSLSQLNSTQLRSLQYSSYVHHSFNSFIYIRIQFNFNLIVRFNFNECHPFYCFLSWRYKKFKLMFISTQNPINWNSIESNHPNILYAKSSKYSFVL